MNCANDSRLIMKTITFDRRHGFTLIELLVVIAIIGIIAGLVLAIAPGVGAKRKVSVAYTELRQVETAIEAYKAHYGFYPPDNPSPNNTNPLVGSPLYFELAGTINKGAVCTTLDGRASIPERGLAGSACLRIRLLASDTGRWDWDRKKTQPMAKSRSWLRVAATDE